MSDNENESAFVSGTHAEQLAPYAAGVAGEGDGKGAKRKHDGEGEGDGDDVPQQTVTVKHEPKAEAGPGAGSPEGDAGLQQPVKRAAAPQKRASRAPMLTYVPWQYLENEQVLKACISFAQPFDIPGKCMIVKIRFDYQKFEEMVPECPRIQPPNSENFYMDHPWMKNAFGYSVKINEKNEVQNQFRVNYSDYINRFVEDANGAMIKDPDFDGARFREVAKKLDAFFVQQMQANADIWNLGLKIKKGETPTIESVNQKYVGFDRDSSKGGPSYMTLKYNTQKADRRKGTTEDRSVAHVNLWEWTGNTLEDAEGKLTPERVLRAKVLTMDNSVPDDAGGKASDALLAERRILLDKGHYCKNIFCVEKLFFSNLGNGPSAVLTHIMYANEEALTKDSGAPGEEVCPF